MFFPFVANTAKRLLNAESLGDLSSMKRSKGGVSWSVESPLTSTPPGTPPPPYHGTPQHRKESGTSVPSPPVPPPPPDEIDEGSKLEVSSSFFKKQIFWRFFSSLLFCRIHSVARKQRRLLGLLKLLSSRWRTMICPIKIW